MCPSPSQAHQSPPPLFPPGPFAQRSSSPLNKTVPAVFLQSKPFFFLSLFFLSGPHYLEQYSPCPAKRDCGCICSSFPQSPPPLSRVAEKAFFPLLSTSQILRGGISPPPPTLWWVRAPSLPFRRLFRIPRDFPLSFFKASSLSFLGLRNQVFFSSSPFLPAALVRCPELFSRMCNLRTPLAYSLSLQTQRNSPAPFCPSVPVFLLALTPFLNAGTRCSALLAASRWLMAILPPLSFPADRKQ